MGGGAYSRFGQSLAKTSDLALVAISHLHPDHVSDLPAFLWLSHQVRNEPLPIVGPSGNSVAGPAANDIAPDFPTFLARLFDEKNGAFQVLGGTLGGKGNGVRLNASVVDAKKAEPTTVFEGQGLKVSAMHFGAVDDPGCGSLSGAAYLSERLPCSAMMKGASRSKYRVAASER